MNKNITRRDFLKTTAILGISSTLNAVDLDLKSILWDEEVDVIVVGSGLAGTVSSIYCAQNGLKTLMIEKSRQIGGSSMLSTLEMSIVNSPMQRKANIVDFPELLAKDMNKAGRGLNQYEHSLNIAKNSTRAMEFIVNKGANFYQKVKWEKGHSVARTICPVDGGARGVMQPLHKHLFSLNEVSLHVKTQARTILKDNTGKVIGIEVLKYDKKSFKTYRYKAKAGIIYATGGYSRDQSFRTIQNPLVKYISSTTHKESKADALKYLIQAGAIPVHLSLMRFAFSIPMDIMKYGCMLNLKTSSRFVDEGSSRQELAKAILMSMSENNTKKYPIIVYDTNGVNSFADNGLLKQYFKTKIIKKFSSIKEICKHYALNENKVAKEIITYNRFVKSGIDKKFNKFFSSNIKDINKAPYYTITIKPKLNYTQGGVFIDTKARVIDLLSNRPIENLYAAGEATGGIHGYSRLISCSTPDCLVYGLIAAEEIVKKFKMQ